MGCGNPKATAAVSSSVLNTDVAILTPRTVSAASKISTVHSEHESNQDFIILWVDSNMDESNNRYKKSIIKLRQLTSLMNTYKQSDQCIDYLKTIVGKKSFLIVSHDLGEELVPLVHDKPVLNSIYIFSEGRRQKLLWANKWSKIKGIYLNMETICNAIKEDNTQIGNESIPLGILSVPEIIDHSLNELNRSFMYALIYKEILLEMEYDNTSKKKFIEFFRKRYIDNDYQLGLIDEFDGNYKPKSAIWWYTKESFIFPMLNQSLRKQDSEAILKMGFFIFDLHQQITQLYNKQSNNRSSFTVYRGQSILLNDFEKMKNGKGGLLSFNNFLSTTPNSNALTEFTARIYGNPNIVAVLFRMKIDPKKSSIPFAILDNLTSYKSEKEILFSMHTVFRLGEIHQINERLWQVELTLPNDNDQQIKTLIDHFREEIGGGTPWQRLGHLMLKMDEYDRAEEIYRTLIDSVNENDQPAPAHLYHQLGCVNSKKGEYTAALSNYKKALDIKEKSLGTDHPSLATTYNNIGGVYKNMGYHKTALSYYEKTRLIQEKSLPPNHPSLATTYSNIGSVYNSMSDYSTALQFYEKSLEIRKITLPPNHPDWGTIYNNIADVHKSMGDDSTALSYYEKALKIQEKSLPSDDLKLATTYNNIALIYHTMKNYSNAVSFNKKALSIREKSLPFDDSAILTCYNNLAASYHLMNDLPNALLFYEKVLHIREKSPSPDDSSLTIACGNAGSIYYSMKDYPKALSLYQKVLKIQQKVLSANHLELSTTYNNLGSVYYGTKDFKNANEFFQKALKIKLTSPTVPIEDLAVTYNNLASASYAMIDYKNAIVYYKKLLEIRKTSSDNDKTLALVYNNVGYIYYQLEDYTNALFYYQQLLNIREKTLPPDDLLLATAYNNVAMAYQSMKDSSNAILFYEKALRIREKSKPPDQQSLINLYDHIGSLYQSLNNYTAAAANYEKSIQIQEKLPSPNYPSLAITCYDTAKVYEQLKDYQKAVKHAERSLQIALKAFGPKNSEVIQYQTYVNGLRKKL